MLGIEEGIKRIREREEAIHPPDHKYHDWRENCRKKEHCFLQNRKLSLTCKKQCLRKKEKHKSITSEKYLKKKYTFELFYPKICTQRMSIIYGKRKNCFPLAINYACCL